MIDSPRRPGRHRRGVRQRAGRRTGVAVVSAAVTADPAYASGSLLVAVPRGSGGPA